MNPDVWDDAPDQIGVLAGGGTVAGIFSPLFFQMQFLDGTPEEDLTYFDFQEKEESNGTRIR